MYEHYERHRTDNITDPALRRAHPISTISGWDRDRDDDVHQQKTAAVTNSQTNGTAVLSDSAQLPYKVRKVSKSEQTDENDIVDLEHVKCACDDDETKADGKVKTSVAADETTETKKPISSISNISQVYNDTVVCNGSGAHAVSSEDESMNSPQKSTGDDADALKKKLEVDSHREGEDNKQIVKEIVEDILKKSESLLDDCTKSLDEDNNILDEAASISSVIKDEEIELAVSEVVKGVREIEKKAKRDTEKQQQLQATADKATESESLESDKTTDETAQSTDDSGKEKAESNKMSESKSDDFDMDTVEEKMSNGEDEGLDDDVEELENTDNEHIVSDIVNDVIDNCVNRTLTINGNEKCDNDNRKTSTNDNVINNNNNNLTETTTLTETDLNVINNNIESMDKTELATQMAEVVNEVIGEAVKKTNTLKETNEEIVSSIVNDIVDKCVLDNDNSKVKHSDEVRESQASNDKKDEENEPKVEDIDEGETEKTVSDNKSEPKPALGSEQVSAENTKTHNPKLVRSQSTSISTSTQVDNNQFGECE